MRRDALGQALILGLVAVAVVAGLAFTGGPERGRIERRDAQRVQDLYALSALAQCLAATGEKTLPDSLERSELCPGDPLPIDPLTGAAYGYERLSDASYRICGGFERPEDAVMSLRGAAQVDPETGCAVFTYRR